MYSNPIKRHLATACLFGLGALSLNAQTTQNVEDKGNSSTFGIDTNATVAGFYHPFTIAAEVGTGGAGGWVGWRFSNLLGVHAGMDYFKVSGSATIEDITYNVKLEPLNETVGLDLYPWERHSFHVSVGVIVDQSELTGRAAGFYVLNGNLYSGTVDLNVRTQPVNPYISIGGNLFYFDHAHHWAMFGELGIAYVGDARVSLSASDPNATLAVSNQKQKIEDDRNKFPFWPILKLGVSYSF